MSEAASLMPAVLGPAFSAQDAQALLDRAMASEVDPLHWCAVHLGISQCEIMRRVAEWIGLAYYNVVPRLVTTEIAPTRLETLAEMRMFRIKVLDRDVAFAAPDFFGAMRLKRVYAANPALYQSLCLVPAPALRELMVDAAQEALIDGARQTLSRSWPHAAAQLDLTRPVRWSFAIMLVLATGLVLAAPLSGQYWLLPLWFVLVVLPTMLRLAALLTPSRPAFDSDLVIEETDLPVYSILVPLRDEANMVDQLCRSLGQFDYPREKLQIIFVVESRSPETVAAVRRHLDDARFTLAVVPDAMPRTKPKALDFALPLCRGEFVVVYDAEDIPGPDQLRAVVSQFRCDDKVQCIQSGWSSAMAGAGFCPPFLPVNMRPFSRSCCRPSPAGVPSCRWAARPITSALLRSGTLAGGTPIMSPKTPISGCVSPAATSGRRPIPALPWRTRPRRSGRGWGSARAGPRAGCRPSSCIIGARCAC